MKINVATAMQCDPDDLTTMERGKYKARQKANEWRRQNKCIQESSRPDRRYLPDERKMASIAQRIGPIINEKFGGQLAGLLSNIMLALKQEGALKEPNYRRPGDRQATIERAVQIATSNNKITMSKDELGVVTLKTALRASQVMPSRQADLSGMMFRYCSSRHLNELTFH